VKSRVAMDFSGEQGRVVADPNEALGVAFEEGYNWRVSLPLRLTSPYQIPYQVPGSLYLTRLP